MRQFVIVNVIENGMLWRHIAAGYSDLVIGHMESSQEMHPVCDLVAEVAESGESAEGSVMIGGELKTVYVTTPHAVYV